MERAEFAKLSAKKRRKIAAHDICEAISKGSLRPYIDYFASPLMDDRVTCYTCEIGAAAAFLNKFYSMQAYSEFQRETVNCGFNEQAAAVIFMKQCGFSKEHSYCIEYVFEAIGRGIASDEHDGEMEAKYVSLRQEYHNKFPGRGARFAGIWQMIRDNDGVLPGYKGKP